MELKRSPTPYDGTEGWWNNATDITPSGYQSWAPGSPHYVQLNGLTYGQHMYVGLRQKPGAGDPFQYGESLDIYFEPPPPSGGGGSPAVLKGGSPAVLKINEAEHQDQCDCCERTGDGLCCSAC